MISYKSLSLVFVVSLVLGLVVFCTAGNLTPPSDAIQDGQPVAHMKTLNEVEPRTLIDQLPFVISNSGSYYLAADLTGGSGTTGITITCSQVDLDLNGFSLKGGPGSWYGIKSVGLGLDNIAIHDGIVRGWGYQGIQVGATDGRIYNVSAYTNGQIGGAGIDVGKRWLVKDCVVVANGGHGLNTSTEATVENVKASKNSGAGLRVLSYSMIAKCIAKDNGGHGIWVTYNSTVKDCLSDNNGNHGIYVEYYSLVTGNNCSWNNSAGIHVYGGWNRIEKNHCVRGSYGIQCHTSAKRNLIIGNTVMAAATAYSPTTNDRVGQILKWSGMSQAFTNYNPWANFEFEPL